MLRTRLYLGLLPLLLLIVATGGYAIYVCRDLAGSLSRDLLNNYQAVIACQRMRESATLMTSALSPPVLGPEERRVFEEAKTIRIRMEPPQILVDADASSARMYFRKRYRINGRVDREGEVLQELRWVCSPSCVAQRSGKS